jgi:sugar/nucleoside kinase (ribokinase family)
MSRAKFVMADTMDLWLNIALDDLLRLLRRVDGFALNDSEAHQLTKEDNVFAAMRKIHKLGPKYVIIKKGSHGSILSGPKGFFLCPAYPLRKVVDPTGAGDSFVGGLMGYLSTARGSIDTNLRGRQLLLRRLRPHAHDPRNEGGHRAAREGTRGADSVLIGS